MLGYSAAKNVVDVGRPAFFKGNSDLPLGRSRIIQSDDLIPQFGFVGAQYTSMRVLFLGINPGNGKNDCRSKEDRHMMPALSRFAGDPTEENFADAMQAYKDVCQEWPIDYHCSKVLKAGNWSLDQIAFTNCLPWRTKTESNFITFTERAAAKFYLTPLIECLKPELIVALGIKAYRVLQRTDIALPQLIIWNRNRNQKLAKPQNIKALSQITEFSRLL